MGNGYAHAAGNLLLARLPAPDSRRLRCVLHPATLELKQVIYEAHAPIDHVYFPTRGILSFLTVMEDGSAIEMASVGNEGAVGANVLLGSAISGPRVMVQLPGEALRMRVGELRREAEESPSFRRLLLAYLTAFFNQVSQSVACNGLHSILQRCCRWLLVTHDRTGGDELILTHEFLATMLGVRRPGVTDVLESLEERALIVRNRGLIRVLDRKGLEAASCECYRAVRDEYDRLFDLPGD